jgi:hypothetical protein
MYLHEMPMNSERTTRNSDQTTGQEVGPEDSPDIVSPDEPAATDKASAATDAVREIGGRKGPDPTRYGDWEKGGRCIDF